MTCEIRFDLGTITAVVFGLVLFGVGYNALVGWMERRGYTEGYLRWSWRWGLPGR